MELISDLEPRPISWYRDGYWVRSDPGLGNRLEHFLGYIYIQDAASMVPALVLDPRPGELVLDMAAAPGSKTTQMAQLMENTGLIVANDCSRSRLRGLSGNLDRLGVLNTVVTYGDGKGIGRRLPEYFDRALLDAPCSAEGTLRRSQEALMRWGEWGIERMARLQKGLIRSGFRALKPGGVMVYSTCTFAPEENEGVVDYLLKKEENARVESITLEGLRFRPGVLEWQGRIYDPQVGGCIRIYPQDNDTEGFFVARIRKITITRSQRET
jgi:NOL1/NOP2/sun family putative RNA methylase